MKSFKFNWRNVAILFACLAATNSAWAQPTSGTYTMTDGENITANMTLTDDLTINVPSGATATISGVIQPAQLLPALGGGYVTANFTKTGAGTLILTANNALRANVTVDQGTLQVGGGGATGELGSNVTGIVVNKGITSNLAGFLKFNSSGNHTVACIISNGSGGSYGGTVTKQGDGTLCLTGNNTYTAITAATAGVLSIGNGSATGAVAGSIEVAKDATIQFARSNSYTYSGVISEYSMIPAQQGGKVTHSGSGVLTLSGANTYKGKTTVLGGNLTIADGGSIANSNEIAISGGKYLYFMNSNDLVYTMPVTGEGNVSKPIGTGAGEIRFTQPQWGGTTGIMAGAIRIAAVSFPSESVLNYGTIRFEVPSGGELTYSGIISGTGNASVYGGGKAIFTAANTMTGFIAVRNGIFQIGNGSTGSFSSIDHAEVDDGQELVFYQSGAQSFSKIISGAGKVTKKGGNTLKFTADNTCTGITTIEEGTLNIGGWTTAGSIAGNIVNNGTLMFERSNAYTYNGVISGTGIVANRGAALTLGGVNTYTGETQITYASASIILSASGTIENSSGVKLTTAGKFDISSANKKIKNLNGVAGAEVILGTRTLTLGTSTDANCGGGTYAGVISGTAAAANAAIQKYGQGTLILSGTNTYSGRTYIYHGTVEFNSPSSFGTSNLYFSSYSSTLKWTAGNTADISARILQLASNITFDVQNNLVAFAAMLPTGTPTLYKTGSGYLFITADNTRNSAFNVLQGSLMLGNNSAAGSWAGNIDVAQNAFLEFYRSDAYTYSGIISGGGNVRNEGGAAVTLTGNSTFTGALVADMDNVIVGNGATSGSIATQSIIVSQNKALSFNRSDNISYSGVISGNGAVMQQGTGILTLNGANIFKGVTGIISSGTLELGANGTIEHSAAVLLAADNGQFKISSDKKIQYLLAGFANNEIILNGGNLTINDSTADASITVIPPDFVNASP